MISLYIHIPFCKTICSYCDFPKIIAKDELKSKYIENIVNEINNLKIKKDEIYTIYIGGGTPNSISINLLKNLFEALEKYLYCSKENTIELNPELINDELIKLLVDYNFNRVSIGVESTVDSVIKTLNRHHNKQMVIDKINKLKLAGINNINLDFMFGIDKTTLDDIKTDLDFIKQMDVTHISYYSLILEENTVLMHLYKQNKFKPLDEDLCADMYEYICKYLKSIGFNHYEISNFSKPGFESKHNLVYWECKEYIGIGCGASSYYDDYRIDNERILLRYLKNNEVNKEYIDLQERKREFFLLGLRKLSGVKISDYIVKFNSNPLADFDFSELIKNGLIKVSNDTIYIPEDKILLANLVYENFVSN